MNKSSLEGFYYFFMKRSDSNQREYLKHGLGRLARDFPDSDPRVVLVEFLAEHVYDYEQWLEKLERRRYVKKRLKEIQENIQVPSEEGGGSS